MSEYIGLWEIPITLFAVGQRVAAMPDDSSGLLNFGTIIRVRHDVRIEWDNAFPYGCIYNYERIGNKDFSEFRPDGTAYTFVKVTCRKIKRYIKENKLQTTEIKDAK